MVEPILAREQLDTLARLKTVAAVRGFYLAGGTAVAHHLHDRVSRDLDIFSPGEIDLEMVRSSLVSSLPDVEVVAETDAAIHLRTGATRLDVVRYPFPPLEQPLPGPENFPVASLVDLAT